MIQQPVVPRIPLALQASTGVSVDPVTGIVTINPASLSPSIAVQLLQAAAAGLPSSDPHQVGVWWNDNGFPAISQG